MNECASDRTKMEEEEEVVEHVYSRSERRGKKEGNGDVCEGASPDPHSYRVAIRVPFHTNRGICQSFIQS